MAPTTAPMTAPFLSESRDPLPGADCSVNGFAVLRSGFTASAGNRTVATRSLMEIGLGPATCAAALRGIARSASGRIASVISWRSWIRIYSRTAKPVTVPAAIAPAWTLRLLAELDAADARAIALARPLGGTQLNWKPRPDVWSVGQCLDHLCVAGEVYLPAISEALDGHQPAAVDEIRPGWLGRWFIRKYIEPSAETKRATAPKK